METLKTGPRRVLGKRGIAPRVAQNRRERLQHLREASTNPAVGLDKFERLLALEERLATQEQRSAFDRAFAKLQLELPAISERGVLEWPNGRTTTYALWEDINEAIKPHLGRHGFSLLFTVAQDTATVAVTCHLSHVSGHGAETTMRLPLDFSERKNAVQAVGSSTSYGKRYAASALLNLTTSGDDDDGRAAGRERTLSPEQLSELRQLVEQVGTSEERLAALYGAVSLEALPASRYRGALATLRAKGVQ